MFGNQNGGKLFCLWTFFTPLHWGVLAPGGQGLFSNLIASRPGTSGNIDTTPTKKLCRLIDGDPQ